MVIGRKRRQTDGPFSHSAAVWGMRFGFIAALVGGWLLANASEAVSPLVLPPLIPVLGRTVDLAAEPEVWRAAGITVFEMVAGFILATVPALLLGFWLGRSPVRAVVSERLLAWGYVFPVALVYPLFLIWVGVGISSKIAFAAVSAFFPIAYNTIKGLTGVPSRYLQVGRAFGASASMVDRHIRAGAARPMILSGLRLGASMATVSVVLAEMLGAREGLGFMAQEAARQFQVANAYALILILAVITSLVLWVMERILHDPEAARKG